MTKHVFDSRQCIHVWAQQTQDHGRNRHDSCSFQGKTLYSYSTPIARFVEGADGTRYVLHSTDTWSVTTSQQQSQARFATRQYPYFMVLSVGDHTALAHRENVAWYIHLYDSELVRLKAMGWKKFARDGHMGPVFSVVPLVGLYDDAQGYARTFGLECPARDPAADMDAARAEQRAKRTERAAEKYSASLEAQRAARAAAREAHVREVDAWAARVTATEIARFRTDENFSGYVGGAVLLRRRRTAGGADVLETSMGATVPWRDALRIYGKALVCRDRGYGMATAFGRPGERVGQFTVDEIRADGSFRAGCHDIAWHEIERLALEQGELHPDRADQSWAWAKYPRMETVSS